MITAQEIQNHLDSLLKPPGSLGQLEEIAKRLCQIQDTIHPKTRPRACVIFGADHGVVAEGISAWPADVTALVAKSILNSQAASSVLAKATDTVLTVVDMGMKQTIQGTINRKKKATTENFAKVPAMTVEEFWSCFHQGQSIGNRLIEQGHSLLIAGEIGIGNTTSASAIISLMTGRPAIETVGRGANASDEIVSKKRQVVDAAVQKYGDLYQRDAIAGLAAVSGFEIVAMAGFYSTTSTHLLDGVISTAAAMIAETIQSGCNRNMIAAHCGAEPGHRIALDWLKLEPILNNWGMRLGEATGALTALPLLDSAAAICSEMATFQSVGLA
jgi:nicotinate-nucleotide--dimethylbenzimidazole phosphoribosyltransferase